ncbi:MAG: hypothetical protein QM767_22445 [Anaeromyxobacter sp.]
MTPSTSYRRAAALALLWLAAACAGPRAGTSAAFAPAPPAGDPAWASLQQALEARRLLDGPGELQALLAVVTRAPQSPLAPLALRRVAELAAAAPALAQAAEAGLAPLVEAGRLQGLTAARARSARAVAADGLGDPAASARHRAGYGAVTAWSLAGPFVPLAAMDFDLALPGERGPLPAEVSAPAGLPPFRTRALPTPDGTLALEGEPGLWDGYVLASEATLARGGEYLLVIGGGSLGARLGRRGAGAGAARVRRVPGRAGGAPGHAPGRPPPAGDPRGPHPGHAQLPPRLAAAPGRRPLRRPLGGARRQRGGPLRRGRGLAAAAAGPPAPAGAGPAGGGGGAHARGRPGAGPRAGRPRRAADRSRDRPRAAGRGRGAGA